MRTKLISTIFCTLIAMSSLLSAQEQKLTGNAFWDLQEAANDTASIEQTVVFNHSPEKKNPFLNSLYSLVIPGTGQYTSERYTKAVIFIALEAALITYGIINDAKGDEQTKKFQQYADAHWSAERYALWISNHGSDYQIPNNPSSPGSVALDLNRVRNKDFSEINAWENAPHTKGFSHPLPPHGSQQYYELIGKYHQYKFGWDEYDDVNNDGIPDSDGGDYYNLKNADRQFNWYAAERGKANDYYYAAGFAVSALVVNHVLSAIDAFISTKSYNKEIAASFNMKPVDSYNGKGVMSELRISIGF